MYTFFGFSVFLEQMINAYSHSVSVLTFSDDGKLLATYSYGDSKLQVWQVRNHTHTRIGIEREKGGRECTGIDVNSLEYQILQCVFTVLPSVDEPCQLFLKNFCHERWSPSAF